MKRGLVLEGGAMRGMFTCGVLDVLMEAGLTFDGIVGVSAGAIFGSNYKSHQPGRAIRYNLRFCRDPRYGTFRSLLKTGDLYEAEFCYRTLPNELDWFDRETFAKDPTEFFAVCSDVETGCPVYHKCETGSDTDLDWIRASGSLPLAARVVEVEGYKLLDGGLTDSIPLRFMEKQGYDRNVVILTQPLHYVKGKNKTVPLLRLSKYPALAKMAAARQEMYNGQTAYVREQERQGKIFVFRPETALDIGKTEHDPAKLQEVYEKGRAVGEKRLSALRKFLEG